MAKLETFCMNVFHVYAGDDTNLLLKFMSVKISLLSFCWSHSVKIVHILGLMNKYKCFTLATSTVANIYTFILIWILFEFGILLVLLHVFVITTVYGCKEVRMVAHDHEFIRISVVFFDGSVSLPHLK